MRTQNRRSRSALTIAALAALTLVASCINGDEPVIVEPAGGTLFDRYVSLGNSVTAGLQSGGINVQLQRQAYPVLLAEKANASFGIPALSMPGCPPPFAGPLTTTRISEIECNYRSWDAPEVVQNLAVPGAAVADLDATFGTGTVLNTFILGGRTQISAMQDADPTLVSVWIGNNDALSAALTGDTTALTPLAAFQSQFADIVAAINGTDAEDAILIGAVNALAALPALQPGAYFWALAQSPPAGLPTINVANNCAPFDGGGNPNPLSARLISFIGVSYAIAAGEDPVNIDCVNGVQIGAAYVPDYLVDETEQAVIAARVAAFNAYIEQQANDNGWIYLDPNAALVAPALGNPDLIRKCQTLATATDAPSFAAAVAASCPVDLDPATEETFFGSYISFDGVHPSAAGHVVMANALAEALNTAHGLSLPVN
jgi:lysophospholipase L1-like esterase